MILSCEESNVSLKISSKTGSDHISDPFFMMIPELHGVGVCVISFKAESL